MTSAVTEETWNEFHSVVNMTSRELQDWLRTQAADENAEQPPPHAGPETGRHVLAILSKRLGDLTETDAEVMRQVIDTVRAQRPPELDPKAGDGPWRHALMNIGHDPLKPPSGSTA
ncbi:DUF3140 domain-containing protein [Streptomyces globisporus]|uniref:DUF3140 domain-containing protein n=1 Tax=Streptomyces globisporus TaxID=1908 RepID=UPI0004CAB519|nr:DUF3140 domain-containing protein [Streptomyces globisporus]